jgi:hypothetical protein
MIKKGKTFVIKNLKNERSNIMTDTNNTKIANKVSVRYAMKIIGRLGHDNILFDRACSRGCKGFFSSLEHSVCPHCNGELTYIKANGGKPMAISEGTIYPSFGTEQKEKDAKELARRVHGMESIYRFKIFSFMNDDGTFPLPENHTRLVKGAKVELVTMNHSILPSWYEGTDKKTGEKKVKLELMILVYSSYGDYVKIITEGEHTDKIISHPVNTETGAPAPITMPETPAPAPVAAQANPTPAAPVKETPPAGGDLAARMTKLEDMMMQLINMNASAPKAPAPAPKVAAAPQAVEDPAPWEGEDELNSVDPFENAK